MMLGVGYASFKTYQNTTVLMVICICSTLCQIHIVVVGLSRVSGDVKVITGSDLMDQLLRQH